MIDLRGQPEILPHHRNRPQILTEDNIVPNMHVAVGWASNCWNRNDPDHGVFDTDRALQLANELCAYFRLVSKHPDNLEYLEWKYGRLKK